MLPKQKIYVSFQNSIYIYSFVSKYVIYFLAVRVRLRNLYKKNCV